MIPAVWAAVRSEVREEAWSDRGLAPNRNADREDRGGTVGTYACPLPMLTELVLPSPWRLAPVLFGDVYVSLRAGGAGEDWEIATSERGARRFRRGREMGRFGRERGGGGTV